MLGVAWAGDILNRPELSTFTEIFGLVAFVVLMYVLHKIDHAIFHVIHFGIVALLVVLFSLSNICVASAALRNLLSEFQSAISQQNLEKVQSLLKEGVDINDVALLVVKNTTDTRNLSFDVTLIQEVAKAKGGKKALINNFPPHDNGAASAKFFRNIPNATLKALIEAGIDPNVQFPSGLWFAIWDMLMNSERLIFSTLSKEYTHSHIAYNVIERLKILVDNGAKTDFWFGFDTRSAAQYFVENSWDDLVKALTSSEATKATYTAYFSEVINILKNAGADMSKAQDFLESKRDEYRNYPEVIAYINQLDEILTSSFWESWKWWIIGGVILMFMLGGGMQNR